MEQREFDWFIDFLEEKNVKGISKDVWTLVRVPPLPFFDSALPLSFLG